MRQTVLDVFDGNALIEKVGGRGNPEEKMWREFNWEPAVSIRRLTMR